VNALAGSLLLALLLAPQAPFLQFGGMFPGVPWKGIRPYVAQKAPRPARCRTTAEPGSPARTHTCTVRRLLLTNDVRANVTFTVDDSSGNVVSMVIAWHPAREADRAALLDSLGRTYGAPAGTDSVRGAAEWTRGATALKVTARPLAGTTEGGVADPVVVMLINAPLQRAVDGRVRAPAP
jgi:hypothetical protein